MGRLKKQIEQILKEEDKDELKEFTIQVTEDNGKVFYTTYKAKNKTSALTEIARDHKGRDYSYRII